MILFIYGSHGAAMEVYDLVLRNNRFDDHYAAIYFIDDFLDEDEFYGTKRIHFTSCSQYIGKDRAEFIIAAGEPSVRKLLYDRVKDAGFSFATLIDKTALVSHTAKIGEGCVIYAYAVISSDAVIKRNCFVMFQSIIGHHAIVESDCVICPKATVGGYSRIGTQSFLGLGSSMMQQVNVGEKSIVGLGSMVFRSVDDGVTVIGNPARVTRGNSSRRVFSKAGSQSDN